MPQIISVIGCCMADLMVVMNRMPDRGESMRALDFQESPGGKGANAAIAAQRTSHGDPAAPKSEAETRDNDALPTKEYDSTTLKPSQVHTKLDEDVNDIQVRMVCAVGDDQYSEMFQQQFRQSGVDTTGVRVIPGERSSLGFVLVENYTGENRIVFTPGATASWKEEDFNQVTDLGAGVRPDLVVAQLEIRKEVVERMIETAGHAEIDFLLNAAPGDPITAKSYKFITHLLVNETEAAIMTGREPDQVNAGTWSEIAQIFLDRGVKNVVLTLGENGAFYATATHREHVRAYKVDVVDATGAGDTFTGTYAAEYLRQKANGHWDIKSAVVRANKASAFTVGKLGAQVNIPWANEIDTFEADILATELSEAVIPKTELSESESVEV